RGPGVLQVPEVIEQVMAAMPPGQVRPAAGRCWAWRRVPARIMVRGVLGDRLAYSPKLIARPDSGDCREAFHRPVVLEAVGPVIEVDAHDPEGLPPRSPDAPRRSSQKPGIMERLEPVACLVAYKAARRGHVVAFTHHQGVDKHGFPFSVHDLAQIAARRRT